MPYEPGLVGKREVIDRMWATGQHHVTLAATMWRRDVLQANPTPAMGLRDDEALLVAANWEYPGVFVPDPVILHYREHADQTTRSTELRMHDLDYRRLVDGMIVSRMLLEGHDIDMPLSDRYAREGEWDRLHSEHYESQRST